jgi:hypothetical protein
MIRNVSEHLFRVVPENRSKHIELRTSTVEGMQILVDTRGDPIDPIVAKPVLSIHHHVIRHLSIIAG